MPSPRLDFLIFASPKSGTTWLQHLLSAHPEVHCGESRLFGRYLDAANPTGLHITLEEYVALLGRHFHAPVAKESQPEFYDRMLHAMIDVIADTVKLASGKQVYGEKFTPYLGTADDSIQSIARYHSGLRFIHLVRDGRDVIVSAAANWLNNRRHHLKGPAREEAEQHLRDRRIPDDDFERALGYWIESVRAATQSRNLFSHCQVVRYEDLLEHPARELTSLFSFLGVDQDEATVDACIRSASFEELSGGRSRGEEDRFAFFRKGVAGDWTNWLTSQHQQMFQAEAGDLLEPFGYQIGE